MKHLGCWEDDSDRAINSQKFKVNKNSAVSECQLIATGKGFNVFGVESEDECFTASDAGYTYKRYGSENNCKNGIGGDWAMDVYEIICKFVHQIETIIMI